MGIFGKKIEDLMIWLIEVGQGMIFVLDVYVLVWCDYELNEGLVKMVCEFDLCLVEYYCCNVKWLINGELVWMKW